MAGRAALALTAVLLAGCSLNSSSNPPTTPSVGTVPVVTGGTTSTSTGTTPGSSTTAGGSTVTSAALEADLLVPNDTGGFYGIEPQIGQTDLQGSACFQALYPTSAPSSAETYLQGPNGGGLPAYLEAVTAWPSNAQATSAYNAVVNELHGCTNLTTTLSGGGVVHATLSNLSISSLGQATTAFQGNFTLNGNSEVVKLAVVDDGQILLAMVNFDSVPPASGSGLYDNFNSELVTSFGKLA